MSNLQNKITVNEFMTYLEEKLRDFYNMIIF
jgi:hypothetical protein